ncbi:MAG: carbohydrate ABC transporter permease [Fimbriimonadaceae bacterium]
MIKRKEALAGYLFASPWLLGLLLFTLYPVGAAIYYSFCDFSMLKPPMRVGTANYHDLMIDKVFWQALGNTLLYAVLAIPTSTLTALGLAMLLNSRVRFLPLFRTLFFIPSLVPQTSLAMLWLWIFNGEHGVLNAVLNGMLDHTINPLLKAFHHAAIQGPNWLGDVAWTKPTMVVMGMWGVGNAMVIYLASLQDVPSSLIEAAELDGAGAWQKTKNVTLPMISPIILFNLITGMIGALQVFTVPYIMFPDGSPARSGYFYTAYLFDNAFKFNKMGYACAMAWLMFLGILVLTGLSLWFSKKRVYYGGT